VVVVASLSLSLSLHFSPPSLDPPHPAPFPYHRYLEQNNLHGTIPSSLAKLSEMEFLYVHCSLSTHAHYPQPHARHAHWRLDHSSTLSGEARCVHSSG
jgi:hypothetical protein